MNSFEKFAFNLLILFVDLYCITLFLFYLFIFYSFFPKYKSVVFSCIVKKVQMNWNRNIKLKIFIYLFIYLCIYLFIYFLK